VGEVIYAELGLEAAFRCRYHAGIGDEDIEFPVALREELTSIGSNAGERVEV
jgi:hypothetical protein